MVAAVDEVRLAHCLSPEVIEFNDFDPTWAASVLPKVGVIRVKHVPEGRMATIAPDDASPLLQYEGVFARLEDPTILTIVAQDDPYIHTTAFKNKDTLPHMDGYQFPANYRGVTIAGPGNMPDYEVLAYPVVGDERLLMLAGLLRASAQMPLHLYDQLTKPLFNISNEEYQLKDPDLSAGRTAVIYDDGRGMRFHIGSKLRGETPDAEFALNVLLELASTDKACFWIETGDVYITFQRWVCHNALRSRPGPKRQPTVLIRRLLRARSPNQTLRTLNKVRSTY